MTHPIENCPQPDEPMRDRAWTAEQVEAMAAEIIGGDLSYGKRNEGADMLDAFAATLRQQPTNPPEIGSKLVQGEQAGGEREIPTVDLDQDNWEAIKTAASESAWIPPEYYANDWVADVCRFLRHAPAEPCQIVITTSDPDGHHCVAVTRQDAEGRILEALWEAPAALAQNSQGEAWGYVGRHEQQTLAQHGHAQVLSRPLPDLGITTPVYLHAERAMVATDAMLAAFVHTWNGGSEWLPSPMNLTKRQLARARKAYDAFLAAAPSQPEDANCSHTWVTDGIGPTRCSKCLKQPEDAA